jgi:hypothetical protein
MEIETAAGEYVSHKCPATTRELSELQESCARIKRRYDELRRGVEELRNYLVSLGFDNCKPLDKVCALLRGEGGDGK